MSHAERCDEIARLIEDALSDLPSPSDPVQDTRESDVLPAPDGRWRQRPQLREWEQRDVAA